MSFDFATSMGRMTDLYLDNNKYINNIKDSYAVGEEARDKFGPEFAEVFDSLKMMRTLDQTMRQKYETDHKNDDSIQDRSNALSFSKGGSRILDMLSDQMSASMNEKVNAAMSNALKAM